MPNSFLDRTGLAYLWGKITTLVGGKQDTLTFDNTPTANSTNPVTSGGVKAYVDSSQGSLTFDSTPTENSTNPVTSGGIKSYVDANAGGTAITNAEIDTITGTTSGS